MLLTGTFPRLVDEKLRLSIPKPLRDGFSAGGPAALYVAPGTDGSLSLYPEEAFARLADRLAGTSPTARETRDYSRLFFARACRVELDKQGRVRIPQELAGLARLDKKVVLIGVQDHLELWDQQCWEEYLAQRQDSYDQIAESAFTPTTQAITAGSPVAELARTPK